MSSPIDSLHNANSRLRNEIKKLRNNLKELNVGYSKTSASASQASKSPRISEKNKKNLIQDLKQKIEVGIFSPAKSNGSRLNYKSKENLKLEDLQKSAIELKNENLKISSIKSSNKDQESIKRIETATESNRNYKFKAGCESRHCRLIDSLESYYESEEENLSKYGKCELSYIKYKKEHDGGSRRREKKMMEEIEGLRQENSLLKEKIKRLFNQKDKAQGEVKRERDAENKDVSARGRDVENKAVSARGRSYSRNSQKNSKNVRSCASLISVRKKHCHMCTALLAKGFSTVYCKKHNGRTR